MTDRTNLLHSGLRLLFRDQKRVTDAFQSWHNDEDVREHDTIGPVIAHVYRRLQRYLDRLYVLNDSYQVLELPEDGVADAIPETEFPEPSGLLEDLHSPSPTPEYAEILQQGYRSLEILSTRYASVYSVATAIMEPPIANIAHSNLKGIRDLMSELIGALPLVMVQDVTDTHPTLPVNVSAGSRAQDLLRSMWAPKEPSRDDSDEVTHLDAGKRSPVSSSSVGQ